MFLNCVSLVEAPELPATTLGSACYSGMFWACTSLIKAPELPATTLTDNCYGSMFNGCTALTKAPTLPALTLQESCYEKMFQGCTSLNYVKALFVENKRSDTTRNWLDGVASSGTFVKNAAATWNVVGANGVPEGWTVQTVTV